MTNSEVSKIITEFKDKIATSEKPICVCEKIKCPFGVKKNGSFGCRKYLVARHCHLLHRPDGSRRTELYDSSSQYYLYSLPSNVDLLELREENGKFLAQPNIVEDLELEERLNS